jgi:hypothetical protein
MAQGPCYDFVQQTYLDMVGNTTLFECMKTKMAAGTLPECMSMTMAMGECADLGAMMGGGGGGGSWGRRGAHNVQCTPMAPAAVTLTKSDYDNMFKGMIKGMMEPRCDPDGEVKAEDKEK